MAHLTKEWMDAIDSSVHPPSGGLLDISCLYEKNQILADAMVETEEIRDDIRSL